MLQVGGGFGSRGALSPLSKAPLAFSALLGGGKTQRWPESKSESNILFISASLPPGGGGREGLWLRGWEGKSAFLAGVLLW